MLRGQLPPYKQCCGNCSAYREIAAAGGGHASYCAAHPPSLFVSQGVTGSPLEPGGLRAAPMFQGVWPPTTKIRWCREWGPILPELENGQADDAAANNG